LVFPPLIEAANQALALRAFEWKVETGLEWQCTAPNCALHGTAMFQAFIASAA